MTDEEKAEEYTTRKAHEHYHFLFEENNGSPIDFAKLCYLDGLAEGKPKWYDYKTEKPQKEGEYILIIEREFCGQKRQIKCLHYAEETNMGFDFITNHKISKWMELPEV